MLEFINAGLIGYGYAGKTLHAPLLNSTPGIRLHAIASRDGSKVKSDWPDATHYATPEAMLAAPDIDLVVIATPNDTHFPLAKAALQAGKHVVVDKPFTLSQQEAKELIALAHAQDLQLSVFHNRRWDADFLTLRHLLATGELGEVLHFESHFDRYRPEIRDRWREQAGAGSGLWYDLGAHLLDQSLQLFGKPDTLWLDLAQQRPGAQTDDYFHAVLQYGERRVILHASTQVPHTTPRFTLHGRLGSYQKFGLDTQEEQLKLGLAPTDEGFGLDPRPGQLVTVSGETRRCQSITNQQGCYLEFYRGMQQAIQRGTPVPVKAEEAALVMELIELGIESARLGQRLTLGASQAEVNAAVVTPTINAPLPPSTPAQVAGAATPSSLTSRPHNQTAATAQARTYSPAKNAPSSPFAHERPQGMRQPLAPRQPQASPLPHSAGIPVPNRSTVRPTVTQRSAPNPHASGFNTPSMSPQESRNPRPQPAHSTDLGARAPLAGEHLLTSSQDQAQPDIAQRPISVTQSSTGFIRTDKPRGMSVPPSPFTAQSALAHTESSRNIPTASSKPVAATHHSAEKATTPPPANSTTAASRSPLSSYGRSAQFQPGNRSEPLILARDTKEAEDELLLPELSPSSLIASEHEAGMQAGKGPLLPRMSVKDEGEPDDDLPSFTAR